MTGQSAMARRVRDLLGDAARALAASGTPRLDAEILLAHGLGKDRSWLYAHGDETPDADARIACEALIQRRAGGEPVAYITGVKEFRALPLNVGPGVLIPRPETELLVELALAQFAGDRPRRIADLGTGSGCIALALAAAWPQAHIIAADASGTALEIARANARRLGLNNIEFRQGDWYECLQGKRFELLISNPPYVADHDLHLAQGDVAFEPAGALRGGHDGLDAIRTLARGARVHLESGGRLLLEHGHDQSAAVRQLLHDAGFRNVTAHKDLNGHDRAVMALCRG